MQIYLSAVLSYKKGKVDRRVNCNRFSIIVLTAQGGMAEVVCGDRHFVVRTSVRYTAVCSADFSPLYGCGLQSALRTI